MLTFVFISIAVLFYFLPAIICIIRSHLNATAIFMTNLLLGWTVVGWVVALIWSFTNNPVPTARHPMKLLKIILALTILLASLAISTAVRTHAPKTSAAATAPAEAPPAVRTGVPVPADELLGN